MSAYTSYFDGQNHHADRTPEEQHRVLQKYLARWPFLRQLKFDLGMFFNLRSQGKLITQEGMPTFDFVLSINAFGLQIVEDLTNQFHRIVQNLAKATALANHFAMGRKEQEDPLPITSFGLQLPPLDFWHQEGILRDGKYRIGRIVIDAAHQARSYNHEYKWILSKLPHWLDAPRRWKAQHGFKTVRETPKTNIVLSHEGSQQIGLGDLAELLLSNTSDRALVQSFVLRFQAFSDLWDRLMIVTIPGPAIDTCLAFTAAHLKLFSAALQQARRLEKASAELEEMLIRAATAGVLQDDQAVVLHLKSFDDDSATAYRDDLVKYLGPHRHIFSVLLQRWQTDKLNQAVKKLTWVEKQMRPWVSSHGDDPKNQGIHL